jgi:hypothetical protein
MLVDVDFGSDPIVEMLSGAMGRGSSVPRRIGNREGMYLVTHWSIERLTPVRERWREAEYSSLPFDEYGVCDTPEQAVEKLGLRDMPEKFFVTFVRMRRDEQPSDGGWRWHKWGPYIGDQDPQCEYLHDEPLIEEVYTFHVYEPLGV